MTDQQINIAVAEACGWKPLGKIRGRLRARLMWQSPRYDFIQCTEWKLPRYCSDLNTMDEALKILSHEQQPIYLDILTRKVLMKDEGVSSWDRHTATARQRAEAFLRTLNLWRDDTTERKETK